MVLEHRLHVLFTTEPAVTSMVLDYGELSTTCQMNEHMNKRPTQSITGHSIS